MNKLEYRRECLRRNHILQRDILTFHQQFPPVFTWDAEQCKQFPEWLRSILEPSGIIDAFGNSLYIGRPQKFEDLETLNSIQIEGFRRLMIGEGKYYEAVEAVKNKKKEPYEAEYGKALRELLTKWPKVDESTFLHGVFEPYRPSVIVSLFNQNKFDKAELKKQFNRIGGKLKVKIWIPIYEDTSSDDLEWKHISMLQELVYGIKRKSRPDLYERKLKVWKTYQEVQNYAEVGKRLRLARKTVEDLYTSVFKDIMGFPLTGKKRERRAKGIDGKSHFAECEQCKKGKLCPTGEVLVNVNSGYQREIFRLPDDNLLPSNHEAEGQAGGKKVPTRQETRHKTKKAIIREVFTCRKCKRRFLMYYPPKTCVDHKGEKEI